MSESMDVEEQWLHDLGVSEGIDHLHDPVVAAARSGSFEDVLCVNCGEEEMSP